MASLRASVSGGVVEGRRGAASLDPCANARVRISTIHERLVHESRCCSRHLRWWGDAACGSGTSCALRIRSTLMPLEAWDFCSRAAPMIEAPKLEQSLNIGIER